MQTTHRGTSLLGLFLCTVMVMLIVGVLVGRGMVQLDAAENNAGHWSIDKYGMRSWHWVTESKPVASK